MFHNGDTMRRTERRSRSALAGGSPVSNDINQPVLCLVSPSTPRLAWIPALVSPIRWVSGRLSLRPRIETTYVTVGGFRGFRAFRCKVGGAVLRRVDSSEGSVEVCAVLAGSLANGDDLVVLQVM